MTGPRPRILIVGAGPTGLTAALELVRLGFSPTLIDRKDGPSGLSRAVGILPAAMSVWRPSGVAAAIAAEAVEIAGMQLHRGRTPVLRLPMAGAGDPFERMFGLSQNRTEDILRGALERLGGRVQFGTELTTLAQTADEVVAGLNGREARFDFAIGADGTRSFTRTALGVGYVGFDAPGNWSIADVEVADLADPTWARVFLLPKGAAALMLPLGPSRVRVVSNTPDALAALPMPLCVRHVHRRGGFTVSVRQADRYFRGRVFLAGDAAHCHSPVGGRGMNLGIADAADLAARFADGDLEGYHGARHGAGQAVMQFSERLRGVLTSRSALVRAGSLGVMTVLDHLPFAKRRVARRMLSL